MSNATFNKYWAEANKELADQLEYESPKDPNLTPKDRETAFQHLAVLYVRYIQVFRKLENAYDQMVHPQKRRLLKDVVLATMGRVLELKHKMAELELSDFHNLSEILLDLKLSPDDLRLPVPRFFVEEREKDIAAHKALLDSLGAKEVGSDEVIPPFPPLKISDAIRIIQINERGRQGRLRAKYMADIKLQAQREKELDQNEEEMEVNTAAVRIQRVYKGYKARQFFKKMRDEELTFLGMANISKDSKTNPLLKAENNRNRRKVIQQQHEEEYQQALVNTKEKITKVEGPDMKEALQDSFRQWYMEYKRINNKFPDFPADEVWQNPSFKFELTPDGQIPTAVAEAEGAKKDESKPSTAASGKGKGGKGDKGGKGKAGKGGDTKKGAAGKKGAKQEEEEDPDKYKFDNSTFLTGINNERAAYGEKWVKKDESDNFAQKHDQETVKNEKRREVEAEIKNQVMEVLKEELKNLKMAVDREKGGKKGKKGRKGKGKKGKKGGKKGGKGGKKGKKGKKAKDLTADRTMESLVEELIQTGILQKYPQVSVKDFKGEFDVLSVSGTKDPMIKPALGEVQRVVTEYCILPLGPSNEQLPIPGITSALLFGPKGSGKSTLVNAVASELGAWLFNLTPRNTVGQFSGKGNVAKMVHMVFKVAKANPPAIVYIDNVEMIFAKKVPKDDTSEPKRIRKDLLKAMKALRPENRVLVLGTSHKPWDGDLKALLPPFQRHIPVPRPEYGSRNALWTYFIGKRVPSAVKEINISLLTRISDGLSAGQVSLACERALTNRRLKLLRLRPLVTNEIVEQVLNMAPFSKDDDKPFWEFYEKTPLVKKRTAMLAEPEDEEAEKGKKKGAKGKDTKKKKK